MKLNHKSAISSNKRSVILQPVKLTSFPQNIIKDKVCGNESAILLLIMFMITHKWFKYPTPCTHEMGAHQNGKVHEHSAC